MDGGLEPAHLAAVRRLAAAGLLAVAAGCGGAHRSAHATEPSQAPLAIPRFDLSVDEAITYLGEFGIECLGPERPLPDPREWLCRQEQTGGSVREVRIVADAAGVSGLVGIAHRHTADDAVAFLTGVVASLVLDENHGSAVRACAAEHPDDGREWSFERAVIRLQAHSRARAIIVDPPE